MAGDWIKWMKGLSRRREVIVLARKLGISRREAACACMEMWEWADGETANGHIKGATGEDIDRLVDLPGFATALLSSEVAWLTVNSQGITFPRWTRNNGESAKRRANDAAKKRLSRRKPLDYKELNAGQVSLKKRDMCPEDVPKNKGQKTVREEREESERREDHSTRERTDRPIGADQSAAPPHSRKEFSSQERKEPPGEPLDLSRVDWSHVEAMAESVGDRVPPQTPEDRRAWLRYSVMAEVMFCEAWLIESAQHAKTTRELNSTKKSRQAHFVATLKSKAAEPPWAVDSDTFDGIAARIEIPDVVWKSEVLPLNGRRRR